jgi:hypothetical protein
VGHARNLIESRPFLSRIPDHSLILSDPGTGTHHVQATRDADGSYAFVYLPSCKPVTIDLTKLSGTKLDVYWVDPRAGTARYVGRFPNDGQHAFTPPSVWPDWVLVLDDVARKYPAPAAA